MEKKSYVIDFLLLRLNISRWIGKEESYLSPWDFSSLFPREFFCPSIYENGSLFHHSTILPLCHRWFFLSLLWTYDSVTESREISFNALFLLHLVSPLPHTFLPYTFPVKVINSFHSLHPLSIQTFERQAEVEKGHHNNDMCEHVWHILLQVLKSLLCLVM